MKGILHILATLTIIGSIAGLSLALVAGWANPLIEKNRIAETEKAVYLVNPKAKSYKKIDDPALEIYQVFDEANQPLGYSMIYNGNGFQGNIRVMIGVAPDLKTVNSIEVLEQSETPGLGTKVLEEPYKGQYKGLVVDPSVVIVKGVPASAPGEVQAVTGATISSRAVAAIVTAGLEQLRKKFGGAQ